MYGTEPNHLVPRPDFTKRKIIAWLWVGPFNPVFWVVAVFAQLLSNGGGLVIWLVILPTALGAAIALPRLEDRVTTSNGLSGFVIRWAAITVLIFPSAVLLVAALFSVTSALLINPADLPTVLGSLAPLPLLAFYITALGVLIGAMPAIISAFVVRLIIQPILFQQEAATPEPAMR